MKPQCEICNDTGKRRGSDYLDCTCPAATERVEIEREAIRFAIDYKGDLQHLPEDLRWHFHQRAKARNAERIAELERLLAELMPPHIRFKAESAARYAVHLARNQGQVLTITQRPLQPLAMGNYETVVELRPARRRAEP